MKILFLNPSKWGRGITPIWIASHSAVLRSRGYKIKLFDCTFYREWMVDETEYNTHNLQYKPSEYAKIIKLKEGNVVKELQKTIDSYEPNMIFVSAFSSHLHGEGEYVNIQYAHELMKQISTKAIKVAGGIQPTAIPYEMPKKFPSIDYFIQGESEFVLAELAENLGSNGKLEKTCGLIFNEKQDLIKNMDMIPPYDYSVFEDQIFFRPYNGRVERAVDYEISRGCMYSCSYCVESIIQSYYGFIKAKSGVITRAKEYLRNKSAKRVFEEISSLNRHYNINLFRCQDANFLTVNKDVLNEIADMLDNSNLDIMLYIETRPEGVNPESVRLLKRLKIDGVGMGVEVSGEGFRMESLNRFASQEKILNAFRLLEEAGIKRTAYSIIGLPCQTEEMILDTINFNRRLKPDNVTVAFYSPYIGTREQIKSKEMGCFDDYEYNIDSQLRTVSKSTHVSNELLNFYKKYFIRMVREGTEKSIEFKRMEGIL